MKAEELQAKFLELIGKKVWINVYPLDGWDDWVYSIVAEDCMSPFFVMYKSDVDFQSYLEALDHAIENIEHSLSL